MADTTTTTISAVTGFIAKYSPQWAQSLSIMGIGIVWGVIFALGIATSYIILKRALKKDIEDNESIRSELSNSLEEQNRISNEVQSNTEAISNIKVPDITPLINDIKSLKSRKSVSIDHLVTDQQFDKIIEQFNTINTEMKTEIQEEIDNRIGHVVRMYDEKFAQLKKLIGDLGD